MMKLQTLTLGCSKNKVDTEHILSQVESLYEIVPEGEDVSVDVLLINTCGFIGDAKEESVQAILEAVEPATFTCQYFFGSLKDDIFQCNSPKLSLKLVDGDTRYYDLSLKLEG